MESSSLSSTKSVLWAIIGFCLGSVFTFYIISDSRRRIINVSHINSSINPTVLPSIRVNNSSSTKIVLDKTNLAEYYEEFYRYYAFNNEWLKKTYLGIQFLQNPNDAITIAEILCNQDVDLVIETGAFKGASALFFASIMYQYRYNWNDKTVRPFKVISIDISLEPKANIERYPLLSSYITFIHDSSSSDKAKTMVNDIYKEMKAKNVFISLDADHKARPVYNELVYYQQFSSNIGNYILVQDTRLSKKWFNDYCSESVFDGPCNGPEEAVQWFLKNEGKQRFVIDPTQEYLFTTNHNGWIKRIAP